MRSAACRRYRRGWPANHLRLRSTGACGGGSVLTVFSYLWILPGGAALSGWMLVRLMDDVARQKAVWSHRQGFLILAE